ncbi:MFS transporter [Nocardiopsis sp. RSe5-2]|uniref:MFS transporter n=1 Tax=Nocardiopsis endophytica TaxID=3018445 RepID=A0ABT4U051_9ACTN|nr:MFS transporter [Nocardiopsis endophytica]MDA2810325.1 MFS transporter [Nocardiopsis endophytica]
METTRATPTAEEDPPRAGARAWAGLAVLLLPALLVSMDITVLFVAAPALAAALDPTAAQWLWMMDVYGFVMASLLIAMGGLGDRFGRRRLLLAGGAAFGAASALVAFAPTAELLIAGRVLLGIGAATLAPSTLALICGLFAHPGQRRAAVGAWTAAFSGGAVAGPVSGGLLLEHFWWGSVFLINVPVMVLLLVAAPLLVPESRAPEGGAFDLPGALLSLAALLGLVFAVKHAAEYGMDAPAWLALAVGLAGGALFVLRQRRAAHPLIDLGLFGNPAFSAAVAANASVALAAAGMGFLAFTYLQVVHGLSPFQAALWALPTFLGTVVGVAVAGALVRRVPRGAVIATGLAVSALGFAAIGTVGPTSPVPLFIGAYIVVTLGVGAVGSLANDLVLGSAPRERAGAASGVAETAVELGNALGIAVLGTIAATVYRETMRDEASAAADGAAGQTVAAAAEQAAAMGGEGTALLDTAFAAFTEGMNAAALTGAGVMAAVAVFAALALRGR